MRFSIFNKKDQQILITKISGLKANEPRKSHNSGPVRPLPQKESKTGQSLLHLIITPLTFHSIQYTLSKYRVRFKVVPGANTLQVKQGVTGL